jgi:transcriptional regulator with XRE-family HTH domain
MMGHKSLITGRLIAAARALTGMSQARLAEASALSVQTLMEMEAGGSAPPQSADDAERVQRALEDFGAMFIPESDGIGAGVRLKFLRQDVKQIGRLEGEGGLVKDDDVP